MNMTQEEKEDILMQDLCARIPYNVICKYTYTNYHQDTETIDGPFTPDELYDIYCTPHVFDEIRPYLFPLSSIPKKQKEEFDNKMIELSLQALDDEIDPNEVTLFEIDFYYKNHIDWKGLIPLGLAIDATGLDIY